METETRSRRIQLIALLVAAVVLVSAGYLVIASLRAQPLAASSSSTSAPYPAITFVSSEPSTSGAAAGNASGAIDITEMYGDVITSGEQLPVSNSSSVSDKSSYSGPAGGTFDVVFDALYQGCVSVCPSAVTQVTVATPGFTVLATIPSLPVPFQGNGAGPMNMEATFTIEVMAPSSSYTGTLTLMAYAQ